MVRSDSMVSIISFGIILLRFNCKKASDVKEFSCSGSAWTKLPTLALAKFVCVACLAATFSLDVFTGLVVVDFKQH